MELVQAEDGVTADKLSAAAERAEVLDEETGLRERVELATMKHAFTNFFIVLESAARATGKAEQADDFERQVLEKFLAPAESGKVVRDAVADGDLKLARARMATEYACYVLFTVPPPAYAKNFGGAKPGDAATVAKIRGLMDEEQPGVAAKFLAGYRRAAKELPKGWAAGIKPTEEGRAAAAAFAKKHDLAGVRGAAPEAAGPEPADEGDQPMNAGDGPGRDHSDEVRAVMAKVVRKTPEELAAWAKAGGADAEVEWNPTDERANFLKAVELAEAVDAQLRFDARVAAVQIRRGDREAGKRLIGSLV